MAKPELGTKRLCTSCGTKYYDLNRTPILCPKCGTTFEVGTPPVRAKAAAKAVVVPDVEVEEETPDVEIVSLEEADAEAAGTDEVADIEDGEIADIDPELDDEADAFLEEEDEGDDVADILGDVEDEEER